MLDIFYHAYSGTSCYPCGPGFMEEWPCIMCPTSSLEEFTFPYSFQPKWNKPHAKEMPCEKRCSHEILLYLLFHRSWRRAFPRMTWVPEPKHWSRKLNNSHLETQTCSPGFGQSPHLAHTHIMLCAQITHPKCFVKYKSRQLLELVLLVCLCLQG